VTTWVALLRGVNLGPARRVSMPELRGTLADRGVPDARTHLQSGNVVLSHDGSADDVAALVHDAVLALGIDSAVVVRSGDELRDLVARNPWPDRTGEPTKLNVGFLSAPGDGTVKGASAAEEVVFDGAEVWLWYGDGQARSKLAVDVGDRVVTVRNWRTVTALAELAG